MIKTDQGGVVKIRMPTAVLGLDIQEKSPVTSVLMEVDQGEGKLLCYFADLSSSLTDHCSIANFKQMLV